jgi:predicted NAD/FAD-dependent oxidoreductase
MATRRIEDAVFDHGAQFFTARSTEFKAMVDEWREAGAVVEWCRGFPIDGEAAPSENFPRYRGNGGMTAITKFLATETNVHLRHRVLRVEHDVSGWRVVTESGEVFIADAVVLTAPVPQSVAVLDAGHYALPPNIRHQLETIAYEPCIAVLALLEGPSTLPPPGAIQFSSEPVSWMADNYQKGISPRPGTITIHAGPKFSRSHWEADDATIVAALTERAQQWLGHAVVSYQVQRWRYSKVVKNHPWPCLTIESPAPLVFAGDAFAGAKVEGAAMSGLAAARCLLNSNARKS